MLSTDDLDQPNGDDPTARTWRALDDDRGVEALCDPLTGVRPNPDKTVQVPTPTLPGGC